MVRLVGIDADIQRLGDLPAGGDLPGVPGVRGAEAAVAGRDIEDAGIAGVVIESHQVWMVKAELAPAGRGVAEEQAAGREVRAHDVLLGAERAGVESMGDPSRGRRAGEDHRRQGQGGGCAEAGHGHQSSREPHTG